MALHHTNDELLDASRVTLIPGTLPTFNLPKKKPSFIREAAFSLR